MMVGWPGIALPGPCVPPIVQEGGVENRGDQTLIPASRRRERATIRIRPRAAAQFASFMDATLIVILPSFSDTSPDASTVFETYSISFSFLFWV